MSLKYLYERCIILMLALLVGFMSACVGDNKSDDNPDNTSQVESGLSPDGMPNDKDSCPDLPNPPNYSLGMSCATEHDCTDVPVACEDPNDPSWDTCEPVWVGCINNQCRTQPNNDWDEYGDQCDPDDDEDYVCDPGIFQAPVNALVIPVDCEGSDNCQWSWNPDQMNTDWDLSQDDNSTVGDLWGDVCDEDDDNDNVTDDDDNCQFKPNSDQVNTDGDEDGDACDADDDNDGDADDNDTCPWDWDPWQEDYDNDGVHGVGGGDVCDEDDDNDNVTDDDDNCLLLYNPDQSNQDGDEDGDACDTDCDNDGVEEVDEEDLPNPFCGEACEVDGDCAPTDACVTEMACVEHTCVASGWQDVNDDDNCTIDSCDPVTGVVSHVEKDCGGDLCGGPMCNSPSGECIPVKQSPITDNNACTVDECDPDTGDITHTPINCDDGNMCNGTETCNPESGCVAGASPTCDDDNMCTTDSCSSNACQHMAVTTNDENMCTTDSCNPATGVAHAPVNCDDENMCTTDSCNPATGCGHTAVTCDDLEPTTTDSCNPEVGCTYTPNDMVTIKVVATHNAASTIRLDYNGTHVSGGTFDGTKTTFEVTISKTAACNWGVNASVLTGTWWGCPGSTNPSKTTLEFRVNGVSKTATLVPSDGACVGGEGDAHLSDDGETPNDLGCVDSP